MFRFVQRQIKKFFFLTWGPLFGVFYHEGDKGGGASKAIEALKRIAEYGNDTKQTIMLNQGGHFVWTWAYYDTRMQEWLFQQKAQQKSVVFVSKSRTYVRQPDLRLLDSKP